MGVLCWTDMITKRMFLDMLYMFSTQQEPGTVLPAPSPMGSFAAGTTFNAPNWQIYQRRSAQLPSVPAKPSWIANDYAPWLERKDTPGGKGSDERHHASRDPRSPFRSNGCVTWSSRSSGSVSVSRRTPAHRQHRQRRLTHRRRSRGAPLPDKGRCGSAGRFQPGRQPISHIYEERSSDRGLGQWRGCALNRSRVAGEVARGNRFGNRCPVRVSLEQRGRCSASHAETSNARHTALARLYSHACHAHRRT